MTLNEGDFWGKGFWVGLMVCLVLWILAWVVCGCSSAQRKVCVICNLVSLPFDKPVATYPTTQPFGVDSNTGELR